MVVRDGLYHEDTIVGTGVGITFGIQLTSGNYTVLAFNPGTQCSTMMNGSTNINEAPLKFNLVPQGNTCIGNVLGLDNS